MSSHQLPVDQTDFYTQLNVILDGDPDLDELGLVVSACSSEFGLEPSGSDAPFFHHDHKLGIAFHAIPSIIAQALRVFRSQTNGPELSPATRALLLVNADHYTAWNRRRRMVPDGIVVPAQELKLLNLIFSKHPKSGESWAYRRWLLSLPGTVLNEELIAKEMAICDRVSDIYPRNYYAWSHRRWLCDQFPVDLAKRLTESNGWITMHISDYSALHYRLTLVRDQLRIGEGDLDGEFEFAHQICTRYPGHESIWYYLKGLWSLLPTSSDSISSKRLQSERCFVQHCIDQDDAANYAVQRANAASYLFYVLFRNSVNDEIHSAELHQLAIQLQSWTPHHKRLWQKLHCVIQSQNK